jgi:Domain of unknown function (DUF1993)
MPLSMYQASIPAFVRMLTNLQAILDKAAAHATARAKSNLPCCSIRDFILTCSRSFVRSSLPLTLLRVQVVGLRSGPTDV